MALTTNFGKSVKKRLIDLSMSTNELASAVNEMTGLYCTDKYLSAIFTGKRNAPKIKAAICEILEIEEE